MIKKWIREKLEEFLKRKLGKEGKVKFEVDKPRKETFGDYATNLALVLAGRLKKSPIEVAEEIASFFEGEDFVEKAEVAKPGFVNFWISKDYYLSLLKEVIKNKDHFASSNLGAGKRVLVEFVSANPTGPLHIGHGRGAAYGDSLARILKYTGYEVVKEYYINDHGTQMQILGRSVYLRAKELKGEPVEFPEDHYKGDYIYDIAKKVLEKHPEILNISEDEAISICRKEALCEILNEIKQDLSEFRVEFDNWFSETSLYKEGKVEALVKELEKRGLVYEKDGALWFKSSEFGDEKDRVIKRSTGDFTYFAGDIAYHYNKFKERGFDECINLWGADHHGYVTRLKAAIKALGIEEDRLTVLLIQMVNLIEGGEKKSMSTRQGEFVSLKELVKEVGVDATRFIFLSRSSDSPLDFDVELAKKQSQENPVYYVQYAHARICSIFRKAKELDIKISNLEKVNLEALQLSEELKLMKRLEEFREVIEASALSFSPYRITYFLLDFASDFHEYYTHYRVLGEEKEVMYARLCLCEACRIVFKIGLELLGVEAPEQM